MNKTIIGIDNGVTGTIGVINGNHGDDFIQTPIIKQQDYTKKKKIVSRIDVEKMSAYLSIHVPRPDRVMCIIERPMVNPGRFNATMSAIRALESMLTILEFLEYPYVFIDSKEWQKALLPSGFKGSDLKIASKDIGIRMFPRFKELILKHGDADGILIAEYGRMKF